MLSDEKNGGHDHNRNLAAMAEGIAFAQKFFESIPELVGDLENSSHVAFIQSLDAIGKGKKKKKNFYPPRG